MKIVSMIAFAIACAESVSAVSILHTPAGPLVDGAAAAASGNDSSSSGVNYTASFPINVTESSTKISLEFDGALYLANDGSFSFANQQWEFDVWGSKSSMFGSPYSGDRSVTIPNSIVSYTDTGKTTVDGLEVYHFVTSPFDFVTSNADLYASIRASSDRDLDGQIWMATSATADPLGSNYYFEDTGAFTLPVPFAPTLVSFNTTVKAYGATSVPDTGPGIVGSLALLGVTFAARSRKCA